MQSDNPHKGKRTHQKKPQLKCEQHLKKKDVKELCEHTSAQVAQGAFPGATISTADASGLLMSLYLVTAERKICVLSTWVPSFVLFYFVWICFLYQLCPAQRQHENFVGSVLLARNPVTFMYPEGNGDLTNATGLGLASHQHRTAPIAQHRVPEHLFLKTDLLSYEPLRATSIQIAIPN